MGTQGSITIYDKEGHDIANIVTQYDGYDLYEWVERFLSGKKITNGISNDYDFNGMSDLAARLIAALKNQRYKSDIGQPVKPGNVYLYSSPYQTDYHIDIRFGGEGQKPRMSVQQGDDWYDPHYHETQLPPLGEANVRMQGAETFNSYKVAPELSSYTKEELIDSKAGPQGTDTYDEMEYDPIAQDRLSAEECSKCVVDRELSGLGKGSSIGFHTSSRSACPSWCINAQDRLSAEELFPPYAYDYPDEVKARVLNKILLWHENMQLQSDEIADRMDRILWMLDNPDKYWEDWDLHAKDMGYEGYDAEMNSPAGKMKSKSTGFSELDKMIDKEAKRISKNERTMELLKRFAHLKGAESFASDEYRLCEICESTHHENSFRFSDDEEQTMTPKGKVCDGCFGDILYDDFQNADDRDWAKQYLESKGFQPYTIEGSFEDGFASETSSTLKSIGYVAGTVGVGYLLFQRFLKDKLDKTMNPDS